MPETRSVREALASIVENYTFVYGDEPKNPAVPYALYCRRDCDVDLYTSDELPYARVDLGKAAPFTSQ